MIKFLQTEFGLDAPELVPLSGGRVNRLWRFGDCVVKVYDHRQVPVERAERAIRLQHTAAALGLPVPAPRPTKSGALWAESDDGLVAVMPFVRGQRRARGTLTATEATNLGHLLGSLHEMLRTVTVGQLTRPSPPAPAAIRDRWQRLRERALAVPNMTDFDLTVIAMADYVSAALDRVPPVDWETLPWQLCHGDLHLDNILFADTGAVAGLLDFDNAAPSWTGVELMMAWNLCFSIDLRRPSLSPEADIFFAAYRQASHLPFDPATALRAYWFTLLRNTWPAALRYRETYVKPEWVEMISLRFAAARWVEAKLNP